MSRKPRKTSKPVKATRTVPTWALDPFRRFLDHQEEMSDILHLSIRGISTLRGMPGVVEALGHSVENGELKRNVDADELDWAKGIAGLAEREIDKGFPLLHSQAVVSLWGSLEDLLRTFLAGWVANEPSAKQASSVQKLKITFGEYERMDDQERCFYLVELLEREIDSRHRQGVTRFESLLESFGLSGKVGKRTQKDIFEMYHVRNVLVHRRGLADRRLIESCPWLHLNMGQQVTASHDMYARYAGAAGDYVLELIQRTRVHFGLRRLTSPQLKARVAKLPARTHPY